MIKVEEVGEINSLISSYMKKGVLTNNFIMQDKYMEYISSGSLYYENTGKLLVLLADHKTHWRIYYHIRELGAEIELPEDKPLVLELVYKNDNEALRNQLDFWVQKGFKPYIHRLRMNGKVENLNYFQSNSCGVVYSDTSQSNRVIYADTTQTGEIHRLISESFDRYLGCVPAMAELEEYIRKNEVLVAEDEAGRLQGILHIGSKNSAYFIWHLLVMPEVRGKGVAKILLTHFFNNINNRENLNAKVQLWVKKDNLSARGLYEAAGLKYDGWESVGFVRI